MKSETTTTVEQEYPEHVAPRLTLKRRIFRVVSPLSLILIVLFSAGFYELGRMVVYRQHPELTSADQANAILKKVAALIQLPAGETPDMATIKDADTAKKAQPFLANAENGDVLIVYATSQTAILYRPSTNKLIAVGPVNSTPTTQQTTPRTQTVTPPAVKQTNATTSDSTKK